MEHTGSSHVRAVVVFAAHACCTIMHAAHTHCTTLQNAPGKGIGRPRADEQQQDEAFVHRWYGDFGREQGIR